MCRVWPLLSVDFKLTLARRDNLHTRPRLGGNTVKGVGLRPTRHESLSDVLRSHRGRTASPSAVTSGPARLPPQHQTVARGHALCELASGKQPAPCSSNTAQGCLSEEGATRRFQGERTRGRRCYIKSCQVAPEARNYYYLPASSILNHDGSTR